LNHTIHTAQWSTIVAVWGVEDFFWIALADGLFRILNYNHFQQFGLLKERMITAKSDAKFSMIRSQKSPEIARDYRYWFKLPEKDSDNRIHNKKR